MRWTSPGRSRADPGRVRDSVFVVTGNNVTSAAGMALVALLTSRFLGPDGRGVVVLFTTTAAFCLLIGTLGVNTLARVRLVSRESRLSLSDFMGFVVVLALFDVVLCLSVGGIVLDRSDALVTPWILPLLTLHGAIYLTSYFLRDALAAFGHNNAATRSETIYALSQLATLTVVEAVHGLSVNGFLLIVVATTSVQLAYLLATMRAHDLLAPPSFAVRTWPALVRLSLPALALAFAQAGAFKVDRLVLGFLADPAAVGIYSVAATIGELVALAPTSIAQVMFSTVALGGDPQRVRDLMRLNVTVVVLGVGLLVVSAPVVVPLLFGPAFAPAVVPMMVLVVGGIPTAFYYVNITVVTASGRLAAASRVPMVGFVLSLVLCLVLVPAHGALGAAVASLVSYTVMAVHARRERAAVDRAAAASVGRDMDAGE